VGHSQVGDGGADQILEGPSICGAEHGRIDGLP
jgi:hypothetical protein